MKSEFSKLSDVLFLGNTYDRNGKDNWDEVHALLVKLGGKIDEVEKRIECAVRSSKEVNESISKYTERVDEEPKPIIDSAPTVQCKNTHTFDKVKEVIHILQTLDNGDSVDGETMGYILKQVGMEDQMLKQLFKPIDNDTLDELLDIRNEFNSEEVRKSRV